MSKNNIKSSFLLISFSIKQTQKERYSWSIPLIILNQIKFTFRQRKQFPVFYDTSKAHYLHIPFLIKRIYFN